jgi:small conductance mechanosensitive channel
MLFASLLAQSATNGQSVEVINEPCAELGPFCDVLLEWTGSPRVAEMLAWFVSVPLRIILIVVIALLANRFARKSVRALMDRLGDVAADTGDKLVSEKNRRRAEQRATTIGSLLRSLSSGLILVVSGVMILELLGLSVVPILASAGILGLAVGFGAQSIIEDFLRGLFMLGEDQFGVGDRIDIGKVNGYVERVTLRTTVIKDPNGILWHVPNSEIGHVANENQHSNRAVVEVAVPYTIDTQHAMEVLAEAARAASGEPEWQEQVRQEPEVRGVQILGENAVVIRVQVWVAGGTMRQFQRHLRQRLKEGLYTAGIEVPNPGLDVWMQDSLAA